MTYLLYHFIDKKAFVSLRRKKVWNLPPGYQSEIKLQRRCLWKWIGEWKGENYWDSCSEIALFSLGYVLLLRLLWRLLLLVVVTQSTPAFTEHLTTLPAILASPTSSFLADKHWFRCWSQTRCSRCSALTSTRSLSSCPLCPVPTSGFARKIQ